MREQKRDPDALYVGLAKQALYKGIPFTFWLIGFVIVAECFLLTRNFWFAGSLGIVLWFVGVWLGRKDPFYLRILSIRFTKCAASRNRLYWGGNHYKP